MILLLSSVDPFSLVFRRGLNICSEDGFTEKLMSNIEGLSTQCDYSCNLLLPRTGEWASQLCRWDWANFDSQIVMEARYWKPWPLIQMVSAHSKQASDMRKHQKGIYALATGRWWWCWAEELDLDIFMLKNTFRGRKLEIVRIIKVWLMLFA